MSTKSGFIFSIVDDPDGEQSSMNGLVVFINTREVWQDRKCLTDGYSEEEDAELEPILDAVGLINLMESTYEPARKITREKLHKKLIDAGLEFDEDFHKWMENEVKG